MNQTMDHPRTVRRDSDPHAGEADQPSNNNLMHPPISTIGPADIFTSKVISLCMAVCTENLQILQPMISTQSIDMMHRQWGWSTHPFHQAAPFALFLLNPFTKNSQLQAI